MANRKRVKGQTRVYNPSHRNKRSSKANPLKTSVAPEWWPVSAPCIWHLYHYSWYKPDDKTWMRKWPDCYNDKRSIFVTQILRNGWPIHGGDRDDFKVTARNPWFCCFLVSCNLLSIISHVPLKVLLKQLMIYRRADNGCQSIANSQITFVKKS